MPSIDLLGVHYAYSDSVPLIRDASFRLQPGWTGVVGPNGAGKTTLLQLLSGALEPDAGLVQANPARLHRHLCLQEVEKLHADVESFGHDTHGLAQRLRGLLRLTPEQLRRWPTLSPGERKRWQIAAVLASPPGALLLDEPTNHLDAEARAALLRALSEYRGVGVVVSHDRSLLEQLTRHTVRIRHGVVSVHRGSYETARSAWEAAEREELSAHTKLKHEQRKERKRLSDKRRARARAESRMRTSHGMKNIHDSDARLRGKQKRRRSAEVALGRDVQLSRRRLGRIDDALSDFHFDKTLGGALFVDFVPAPMPHLMVFEGESLTRGGRVLAADPRAALPRNGRVHVAGPNGSGKTSLLEELIASAKIPAERLLYLPQEILEDDALALLEAAKNLAPAERGRLMSVVAALGVDPAALLESARPSPGEARKLALADGLARQVWALVLDEPTNHLDLPSIERLEEALALYPGGLLLVSHDEAFAKRLCHERWTFCDGALVVEWTGR